MIDSDSYSRWERARQRVRVGPCAHILILPSLHLLSVLLYLSADSIETVKSETDRLVINLMIDMYETSINIRQRLYLIL